MIRIAVVEDDEMVATSVAYCLERQGYQIEVYQDGLVAMQALMHNPPQVAILDLQLPGMDGLAICQRLREAHPNIAIMILTARSAELDRVLGLDSGADDYLVKPFGLRELEARVKALLRRLERVPAANLPDLLRCGSITMDRSNGTVVVEGRSVHLTRREEDVLAFLMQHAGEAVRRERILDAVWGDTHGGEAKIVDVYIRGLRLKLERDPDNPSLLVTQRGRGFRLVVDSQ